MIAIKKFTSLEEGLRHLQVAAKSKPLSIAEILQSLSRKGRPLILILLSLPFCQPLQIPGLSLPFGLTIAFFGLRMLFGKKVWLPKKLLEKNITSATLGKITEKSLKLVGKMKSWIYPRLHWLCHSPVMEKVNALMIVVMGIFLSLPLPIPLSNLAAAWSIFLLAVGILEDDGLFVLLGYLISLLTIGVFLVILLNLKNIF